MLISIGLLLAPACDRGPAPPSAVDRSSTVPPDAKGATVRVVRASPEGVASSGHAPAGPTASTVAKPALAIPPEEMSPRQLYVAYCSACHTLDLVESQRLDRTTWEWVMDDVINKYGGTWITKKERAILVDYLVENFGADNTPEPTPWNDGE